MCASINLRSWRLLLFLGILAVMVQSARCATFANVTFNMEDFTTVRASNRFVEIFPYSTPFSTNSAIIHNDRRRYNTGTNGTFTVTNMVPGCYKIQSSGNWTITPFNICFTNNTGNLNAHDLITTTVSVEDGNRNFVRQSGGVLVSPTNFFTANLFQGANITFVTNSLGQITISTQAPGVTNAVTHNGAGRLLLPTNFFSANVLAGANITVTTNSFGQITVASTGGSGSSAYTNNIDIWLSTRSDADGDGSIQNPRRADTYQRFDAIMIAYGARSNITFRMHPGRYYTQGWCPDAPSNARWQMGRNWRVIGSGIDQTWLTLTNTIAGSATARRFYHVIGSDHSVDSSYSEVSDLTVDCNLDILTNPGTGHTYKTIAAVKLNGSHTAIRRVKAINFGADGIDTPPVNDDVFVISAAATFPQHAPRGSHTIIEDCILMHPSPLTTTNIVEFIHTSGAMNVANALVAYTTNIIIRNNFVDGRYADGTVKIQGAGRKQNHGLTAGSCQLGIVEGNHVQNVEIAGNYQDSFRTASIICRNNTFLDVDAGGLWTFEGHNGEPAIVAGVGLAVTSITSSGTTAVLTTAQALHDVVPGIDLIQVLGVTGAGDEVYNGTFLVTAATANTMTYEMSVPAASATAAGTIYWRVHRQVRDLLYTGNTTLLRHGTVTSYAVGMIGPTNAYDLSFFQNVVVADNYFGFSDGKATNNTGNVGVFIRNAKNAFVSGNVFNLYTNVTPANRLNILTKNNANVIVFNNRHVDGTPVFGYDNTTTPVPAKRWTDYLNVQDLRFYETNGGSMWFQVSAGNLSSNIMAVLPTTNGAPGQVLQTDGGNPALWSWVNNGGGTGIANLSGIGTNATLWASAATGQTNLILRSVAGQLGDLMAGITTGGQVGFSISTNGHVRVATGSSNVTSISRVADYGDGIALDVDITRFLFNTNEVANIANTFGIAHKSDDAALSFGAAGDANLRRLPGGFNISTSNSVNGDGLLQLARLQFVESQGESTQTLQFLAPNMTASMVNIWPGTNGLPGELLTSRVLSGITNQWYWTNAPAGGTSVLSGDFIGHINGIGTNALFYGDNRIAAGSSLVISNTSFIRFTNSSVAINGSGTWINSAITSVPLKVDAMTGTTTNLAEVGLAGSVLWRVNPAGKVHVVDGNAALPAIGRLTDPRDGIYLADGTFGFSVNGDPFASILASGANAGLTHTNDTASLIFGQTAGTVLTGNAGVWTASTSTTAATGAGRGSFTGTNFNVLGALKIRESEVGTPDNFLTLRMPAGVSIGNITTHLWTTNGAVGQALKTTGSNLYWDDVPAGTPGIAATTGTGFNTTFIAVSTVTTNLTVKGLASQTSPLQAWISSANTVLAQVNPGGTFVLPVGTTALPTISSIGNTTDGLILSNNMARFTFNGTLAADISPGGISAIGITNTGVMAHQGPVTYTPRTVTSAATSPRGWIDGALGNLFTLTLTSSTNLSLTNMLEGPTTVIITNPSTHTVTWVSMRTNDWLGGATDFQPVQAQGGVTYWTFVRTGTLTNGAAVHTTAPITRYETLTYSATPVLDFSKNPEQVMTLTGDITSITTAGKVDGIRSISLLIINNTGTPMASPVETSLPDWRWQTAHMTNGFAANTRGTLTLKSYTTGDTEVQAWWNPEVP